jgi:4-hydroxyphenylacetate 3-monooxygenase
VFDDVFVPWEDVFVYRDVRLSRAQFDETQARVLGNSQAQVRLAVKVQFLIGIAHRICEMNQVVQFPAVQEKLGELAAWAAVVEGMVQAAEATAVEIDGALFPNPRFTFSAMALQAELYPRVLHLVRDLAGGGLIQVPASVADLTSPGTAADVARYYSSPGSDATERIKLFKLAWDAVGSEFAGRHHQYEMFYAGPPFVLKMLAAQKYGYEHPVDRVEEFLASYGVTER